MSLLLSRKPSDLTRAFTDSPAYRFARCNPSKSANGSRSRPGLGRSPVRVAAVAQVCSGDCISLLTRESSFQDSKIAKLLQQAQAAERSAPRDDQPTPKHLQTLYIQKSLKSGSHTHHKGSIVVLGDCERGSKVQAEGDVLIFGR